MLLTFIFAIVFATVREKNNINKYKNICQNLELIDIKNIDKTFVGCLKEDGTIKYIGVKSDIFYYLFN